MAYKLIDAAGRKFTESRLTCIFCRRRAPQNRAADNALAHSWHNDPTDWAPDMLDAESTEVPLVHEFIESELSEVSRDRSNHDQSDTEDV